jgi:hypothetical protein
MRGGGLAAGVVLAALLPWAAGAPAAEVIGQTGPGPTCGGFDNNAYEQGQLAAGPSYSPSAHGVVTSWSAMASATPNKTLKLLVLQPNPSGGPNSFVVAEKDEVRTLALAGQLNTFTGVRFPIESDERLGVYVPAGQPGGDGSCAFPTGAGADVLRFPAGFGEPPLGASVNFSGTAPQYRLNASAVVEPDADHDGFGDETQDACPTDGSTQNECIPPQTQITKGPKNKTKKKRATFEFSSTEPSSTFDCSLDGAPFAACSSPETLKVKKGKHNFAVRATDVAGNVDGSPATDNWKVKKKRKK